MSIQNNTSPRKAAWRIGQKVWQWSSTKQALLFTLIPIVVALIASYLLPQAPGNLRIDEFEYKAWLSAQQVRFRNWTPLLSVIGAFYIRETLWFRVLLTILAFVLLVALGEQARILSNPVSIQKPASFYDTAETEPLSSSLPYDQALQRIRRRLPKPLVQTDGQNTTYLYARRYPWARASTALGYLGLLLLTIGLAVHTRWGWRQSEIKVLPHKDIALGPGSALKLRLLDLEMTLGDAQPATTKAHLQIAGQTILPIQMGTPVRHRGYRYLWVSEGGPSVQLYAYRTSAPERPLTLYEYTVRPQPASALLFNFAPGQEVDRQFILSDDKIVGWLRWNEAQFTASSDGSAFYLWILGEDGEELGAKPFEPTESEPNHGALQAVVGDVTYRLEVAQYILLDIAHQPGLSVLWLGVALLALGCAGMLVPQQQVWIKAVAANDHVEIQIRDQRQSLIPARKKWDDTLSQLGDALQVSTSDPDDPAHRHTSTSPSDRNPTTHRKNS